MQVKFLPVDVFNQFKFDNNSTIKELRKTINQQNSVIKHLQQQIQSLKESLNQCKSLIAIGDGSRDLRSRLRGALRAVVQQPEHIAQQQRSEHSEGINNPETQKVIEEQSVHSAIEDGQATANLRLAQGIEDPAYGCGTSQLALRAQIQREKIKPFDTSLLSLPNEHKLKEIQEQLNNQKGEMNIPNDCTIVYQPVGKNLQFEQRNLDAVYQYSSFSKDIQICGDYVIFNTTNPVLIYLKIVDGKTLNVSIKPILVMFYREKLEKIDQNYLGQSWYRLNNFSLDDSLDEYSDISSRVLEISVSKYEEEYLNEIKTMFPNLKFVFNGFEVRYVG